MNINFLLPLWALISLSVKWRRYYNWSLFHRVVVRIKLTEGYDMGICDVFGYSPYILVTPYIPKEEDRKFSSSLHCSYIFFSLKLVRLGVTAWKEFWLVQDIAFVCKQAIFNLHFLEAVYCDKMDFFRTKPLPKF